jgi:oligopeptidase A
MANPLLDTTSLPRFGEIQAEHVIPAVRQVIAQHRRQLDELLVGPVGSFDALVPAVEEMSHELSRIWSPVSHLQSVRNDAAFRAAYNEALPLLSQHGTEVAQNEKLQKAFEAVAAALGEQDAEAQHSLVSQALRDFRLAGVDLPSAQKDRFREVARELATLQAAFEQQLQDASDAWGYHTINIQTLQGLSEQSLARAARQAADRELQGWYLTLDYPNYHAVMTHAENRLLRETFYRAWVTRASDMGEHPEWDNSANIERILALRHELAELTGFASYAEYSLATKMAPSVGEVTQFLRELAARSRATAEAELADIRGIAEHPLKPWDVAFYQEKLKQARFAVSDELLRQYFPADRVIEGLFELAGRLFGLTLERRDDVAAWHASVDYYVVRDSAGEAIGGFYTDLYARTGKRGGAWIDECIVRKKLGGEAVLPVGYLVCNFSPPAEHSPSLLSHDELVTLFHEFGHMLHHLLTRVDYPSIAGINGVPWDAVELPSQFLENFAWHYEVLERTSGHHETGEPLPRDLFDKLDRSRTFGAGLAMLRQLEFALFDFRLHTEYAPGTTELLALLREVRDEVAVIAHPDYNRFPHSFSHIFGGGYSAGYYSYKWAEVLAADAFEAFIEEGVFNQDTASRFRREILEIGGSRDIMQAFIAFRGRRPSIDALLKQCGITA